MEVLAFLFVVGVVAAIVKANSSSEPKSRAQSVPDQPLRSAEGGLQAKCVDEDFTTDDGTKHKIVRVLVSGPLMVPQAKCPVVVKVVALDVTDDPNDPYPIFCSLDSQSDDDGLFQFERQIEVPYEFSSMTEMPVAVLPVFAFGLPKRGRRKLGIVIAFQAVGGSRVYGHASCSCWHDQKRVGYLELEQHRQEQDRTVAMLAIAVCASDGHMDKAETTVIRRYFSERLANVSDAEERRQKVTEVLQETATAIQSGSMLPADLIRSLSEKIRKEDDPTLSQVAYELCVQTVAADGKAAEQELRVLDQIAASLSLQPEFVRESHERHLRMSMYAGAADAALVGMPNGLSKEQKIEFLNNEFRKWRSRVTHQDPSVAADASARLERITRMRRELTNA